MNKTYMALQDADDKSPYGVIRFGDGQVERYDGNGSWFDCPSHADVAYGGEPGGKVVDKPTANALINSGKLVKLKSGAVKQLTGKA